MSTDRLMRLDWNAPYKRETGKTKGFESIWMRVYVVGEIEVRRCDHNRGLTCSLLFDHQPGGCQSRAIVTIVNRWWGIKEKEEENMSSKVRGHFFFFGGGGG